MKIDWKKLREELAEIEHDQWWRWAKYMADNEPVSSIRVERWKEYCFKPYSELAEEEKEKDRLQADIVIALLKKYDFI